MIIMMVMIRVMILPCSNIELLVMILAPILLIPIQLNILTLMTTLMMMMLMMIVVAILLVIVLVHWPHLHLFDQLQLPQ